jgi:phage virion morphogenesis protein
MTDLVALEDWAGALLAKADPAQRQRITRAVGQQLRRSQQRRIAAQRNPDGGAFQPRAKSSKKFMEKAGHIRRKSMFAKLRTRKFLRVDAGLDAIEVGFSGRAAVIARRHQYGSKRRHRGTTYVTPPRELLGLTDQDIELIRDELLSYLSPSK